MAPQKKRPSRKPPPQHVEVSLTRLAGQRLKPYALLAGGAVAVLTFVGLLWSGWVSIGGPSLVTTRTVDEIKSDFSSKIDATKVEVKRHSDQNTVEVKKDVSLVGTAVEKLNRTLLRAQIENLEAQESNLTWSQMPQLINNLAGIEKELLVRKDDQWLLNRKNEVENARKNLEARIADLRARIKQLKDQL